LPPKSHYEFIGSSKIVFKNHRNSYDFSIYQCLMFWAFWGYPPKKCKPKSRLELQEGHEKGVRVVCGVLHLLCVLSALMFYKIAARTVHCIRLNTAKSSCNHIEGVCLSCGSYVLGAEVIRISAIQAEKGSPNNGDPPKSSKPPHPPKASQNHPKSV